jgi:hypothetical protein
MCNFYIFYNFNLLIFVLLKLRWVNLSNPNRLTYESYKQLDRSSFYNFGIFLKTIFEILIFFMFSRHNLPNPSNSTTRSNSYSIFFARVFDSISYASVLWGLINCFIDHYEIFNFLKFFNWPKAFPNYLTPNFISLIS